MNYELTTINNNINMSEKIDDKCHRTKPRFDGCDGHKLVRGRTKSCFDRRARTLQDVRYDMSARQRALKGTDIGSREPFFDEEDCLRPASSCWVRDLTEEGIEPNPGPPFRVFDCDGGIECASSTKHYHTLTNAVKKSHAKGEAPGAPKKNHPGDDQKKSKADLAFIARQKKRSPLVYQCKIDRPTCVEHLHECQGNCLDGCKHKVTFEVALNLTEVKEKEEESDIDLDVSGLSVDAALKQADPERMQGEEDAAAQVQEEKEQDLADQDAPAQGKAAPGTLSLTEKSGVSGAASSSGSGSDNGSDKEEEEEDDQPSDTTTLSGTEQSDVVEEDDEEKSDAPQAFIKAASIDSDGPSTPEDSTPESSDTESEDEKSDDEDAALPPTDKCDMCLYVAFYILFWMYRCILLWVYSCSRAWFIALLRWTINKLRPTVQPDDDDEDEDEDDEDEDEDGVLATAEVTLLSRSAPAAVDEFNMSTRWLCCLWRNKNYRKLDLTEELFSSYDDEDQYFNYDKCKPIFNTNDEEEYTKPRDYQQVPWWIYRVLRFGRHKVDFSEESYYRNYVDAAGFRSHRRAPVYINVVARIVSSEELVRRSGIRDDNTIVRSYIDAISGVAKALMCVEGPRGADGRPGAKVAVTYDNQILENTTQAAWNALLIRSVARASVVGSAPVELQTFRRAALSHPGESGRGYIVSGLRYAIVISCLSTIIALSASSVSNSSRMGRSSFLNLLEQMQPTISLEQHDQEYAGEMLLIEHALDQQSLTRVSPTADVMSACDSPSDDSPTVDRYCLQTAQSYLYLYNRQLSQSCIAQWRRSCCTQIRYDISLHLLLRQSLRTCE